jgi:hypothetical protein
MQWQIKFPDVSFDDKVCIITPDETVVLKHLYHDASELDLIDWDNVLECFEV